MSDEENNVDKDRRVVISEEELNWLRGNLESSRGIITTIVAFIDLASDRPKEALKQIDEQCRQWLEENPRS